MHLRRIFVPPIVALCLIRPAFGQTSPPQSPSEARSASRRLLLEDAQAAASANDHERALRLAQTAGNIEMTPSVRVFLAREYVAVGNYASALGAADLCVREADREPVAERRAVYVTTCQSIRTDARRRIGAVTVQLRAAITGLEVRVNDDLVEPDLYGVPRPVNPGLQRVTARAPGYATFEREVALSAGATVEVPIELSPVEVARTPTQTPAPPELQRRRRPRALRSSGRSS